MFTGYGGTDELRRRNEECNKHFFSPGALRFFRSRIGSNTYLSADGTRAYFVTSEQFDERSPRLYTVRRMHYANGEVDTVGAFQGYATSREANRDAMRFALEEVEIRSA